MRKVKDKGTGPALEQPGGEGPRRGGMYCY
jgi:hypothetical protein